MIRRVLVVASVIAVVAAPAASAAPKSKRCVLQLTTPDKIDLSRTHGRVVIWMDVRARSRLGPAVLRRRARRGLSPSIGPGIKRMTVTLPRKAGPGRYRLSLRFTCGRRSQMVRRTIRLLA